MKTSGLLRIREALVRPHLVALVVPDTDFLKSFAQAQGVAPQLGALAADPELRKAPGAAIDRANKHLSVIEKVRRFQIMSEPFSIDNGMMTPTLKLRRPIIVDRFRGTLDGLYENQRAA